MQREARHADEHRRLQRTDQVELRFRGHRVAGADPVHADIEPVRGARPDLAGRMDADRERHMHEVAFADADAGKGAAPGEQARRSRRRRCADRKQVCRSSRPSARIPRSPGGGTAQNCCMKLCVVEGAQDVLVEDRDGLPHLRIVEPVGVNVVELAAIPGQCLRALEGDALALALDRRDLRARVRQGQGKWRWHGGPQMGRPGREPHVSARRAAGRYPAAAQPSPETAGREAARRSVAGRDDSARRVCA